MAGAITFDFHNTLIACDPWFELETRTLPIQVVTGLSRIGVSLPGLPEDSVLEQTYRALRQEIMAHGNELDALAGTIETLQRLGISAPAEAVATVIDGLFRGLVPQSTPLAGVVPLVRALNEMGIPIGVVSSAVHHEFLEWCLARHGIGDAIPVVVSSASAGYYKSNPEIYRMAVARLGVDPRESVHIGDSFRYDHLSSSSIGMATVWLNQERLQPPPDSARLPDLELANFDSALHAIVDLYTSRRQVCVAD